LQAGSVQSAVEEGVELDWKSGRLKATRTLKAQTTIDVKTKHEMTMDMEVMVMLFD